MYVCMLYYVCIVCVYVYYVCMYVCVCSMHVCMYVCIMCVYACMFVGCCLATKTFNLTQSRMGGGGNGCGSGLLGVTSDKKVTFP